MPQNRLFCESIIKPKYNKGGFYYNNNIKIILGFILTRDSIQVLFFLNVFHCDTNTWPKLLKSKQKYILMHFLFQMNLNSFNTVLLFYRMNIDCIEDRVMCKIVIVIQSLESRTGLHDPFFFLIVQLCGSRDSFNIQTWPKTSTP